MQFSRWKQLGQKPKPHQFSRNYQLVLWRSQCSSYKWVIWKMFWKHGHSMRSFSSFFKKVSLAINLLIENRLSWNSHCRHCCEGFCGFHHSIFGHGCLGSRDARYVRSIPSNMLKDQWHGKNIYILKLPCCST